MSELKLNNLVELVLVVGSDSSSGLELRVNSKTHPKYKKQHREKLKRVQLQRQSTNRNKTPENQNGNGHTQTVNLNSVTVGAGTTSNYHEDDYHYVEERDQNEDVMFQLTDPQADYHAQALQVFSSSLASYPHRSENQQLVNYPHQLSESSTQLPHGILSYCRNVIVEEEVEQVSPSQALESNGRRPARLTKRNLSLAPGTSAYQTSSTASAVARRHSLGIGNNLTSTTMEFSDFVDLSCDEDDDGAKSGKSLTQIGRRKSIATAATSAATLCKTKSAEMPLTLEQIHAICSLSFPDGFRCYELPKKSSLISYVLTDIDGSRFYAVSLTIYKKMEVTPEVTSSSLADQTDGTPKYKLSDPYVKSTTARSDMCVEVFIPTCVVLVASYPYYNTLQKCLNEFHSTIQPSSIDFDDQIKQLAVAVTNIPVPPSGGDLSLTFKLTQRNGIKLTVNPATHPSKSVTDLNMNVIFSLLTPDVICSIISAILQEQRLVFVSSRYALLTLIQETIMHMIYPFRWQAMYVPVLLSSMITLLEAPGYFVMGCHRDYLSTAELVEGLVIIDLDRGKLISSNNEWCSTLPLKAASSLCTKIVDTEMDFDLWITGEVTSDLVKAKEEFQNKVNREISDMFLSMMMDVFGDIYDHIIVDQKFFDKAAFLSSQSGEDQKFYTNILDTTMFKVFLREILSETTPDPWIHKAIAKVSMKRPGSRSSRYFQKKTLVTMQYQNSCKTFNLPYMHNLQQFQDDGILNLSAFTDLDTSAKSSRAAGIYVIGSMNLDRGLLTEALDNFGDLYNMDSSLFPSASIAKVLANQDYPEELIESIKPKHMKLYRELLKTSQSARKNYCTDVKVDLENLPKTAVAADDFQKYAERLDFAIGRDAINRLCQALSLGTGVNIEAEHIRVFYECWKDNEAQCRDMESTLSSKCSGDMDFTDNTVLKVSSSLVRTDYGMGHVILTSSRILLLKSGCQIESVKEVARLSAITQLGVENVKVILTPVQCLRVYTKANSVKPVNIYLEGESKTWKILLDELVGGKVISTDSRDHFLMQQAAQSTLLLEALIMSSRVATPRCLHSTDLDKAVDLLSYYSKEETKQNLLISSQSARDILLYRLNPNADELDTSTVECIIYVPGSSADTMGDPSKRRESMLNKSAVTETNCGSRSVKTISPTVWCGMSNGKIRIFDATSWRLYPRYVQAVDRVVSLAYVKSRVWAGSFDCDIYVIDKDPLDLQFTTLTQHSDYVVCIQNDPESDNSVFSAGINGKIIQWNAEQLEVVREIDCPYNPMTSFRIISHEEIWCCCKDSIIKMDVNETVLSTLFYIDERDRRVQLECFCIVGNEIWAGCSHAGRVHIWEKDTEARRAILPMDARGVGQIVSVGNYVYFGCKSEHISRGSLVNGRKSSQSNVTTTTKSKLYIVNASKYQYTEELSAHTDSIRCMFAVNNQYLLTGSGSREGKIAIWRNPADVETTTV